MTKEELAVALNGREYRNEITKAEEQAAKEAGLVVVFGASDDLCEFRGAIHDEVSCIFGGEVVLTHKGLLGNRCHEDDCPYFAEIAESAHKIKALWCEEENGPSWTYEASFPIHATFEILEDGEKYCRGIVFELAELGRK